MAGNENPEGSQEAAKRAPKDGDQASKDKARVTREANDPGSKIDDMPLPDELGTRKRPKIEVKAGQVDLNEGRFRAVNQHILELAKTNMKDSKEYGDTSEITVDNTNFVLCKNSQGRAYVQVCVIGKSSGVVIEQHVPVEVEDEKSGEIVYNMPPLTDPDVDTLDPEVKRLA